VQVGDIGNLRRTLLLSLQLAEHDIAFTLCLNMSDEPDAPAIAVDALADRLGVPVVAVSALRRWNLEKLKRHAVRPTRSRIAIRYSSAVEEAIAFLRSSGMSRADALTALCGGDASREVAPDIAAGIAAARLEVVDVSHRRGHGGRRNRAGAISSARSACIASGACRSCWACFTRRGCSSESSARARSSISWRRRSSKRM
jgi:Fe2+ transport system protein B